MDVDEIEELEEHLVDALFARVHVFVSELGDLLARLVHAEACSPDDESESDQLTGKLQTVRVPIVPI